MNRVDLKKMSYLLLILIIGFLGTRCAAQKEEIKTYPNHHVDPFKGN